MRVFIHRLLFFIIPCLLGISSVYLIDLPRYYAYYYTKNDGCSITWIYDRIYNNPKPIDIAFIGTSHTGCGINDGYLDSLMPNENVVNLAYCQGGRSIQHSVLTDILDKHRPKKVILEVRQEEDFTSHRDFGYIGRLPAVFGAPLIGNKKYAHDVYKSFQVRYMYFQDRLMHTLPEEPTYKYHVDYYNLNLFKNSAPVEDLTKHYQQRLSQVQSFNDGFIRNWRLMYPYHYLEQIKSLCEKHSIELIFIYIPSFGMAAEKPFNLTEYEKYGRVINPPRDLFNNPKEWTDTEHFNARGSRRFSHWLSNELEK